MAKRSRNPQAEHETRRTHASLKWLLTLLSAIITTGLVVLLNKQLQYDFNTTSTDWQPAGRTDTKAETGLKFTKKFNPRLLTSGASFITGHRAYTQLSPNGKGKTERSIYRFTAGLNNSCKLLFIII